MPDMQYAPVDNADVELGASAERDCCTRCNNSGYWGVDIFSSCCIAFWGVIVSCSSECNGCSCSC